VQRDCRREGGYGPRKRYGSCFAAEWIAVWRSVEGMKSSEKFWRGNFATTRFTPAVKMRLVARFEQTSYENEVYPF
jgi:hypothetical protein